MRIFLQNILQKSDIEFENESEIFQYISNNPEMWLKYGYVQWEP